MIRLALVTSCRNPGALLRDTVGSVLDLTVPDTAGPDGGGIRVDYTVVDAASDDGTAEYLASVVAPPWMRFTFTSEPDEGLYDGLAKGFRRVSGDWAGYVNAGDLIGPGCLSTLGLVTEQHPDVRWVTGLRLLHGHSGRLLHAELPFRYRGDLLERGVYGRSMLPSVQQEATFWRTELIEPELTRLGTFRLAGDLWLWSRFAARLSDRRFPVTVVRAHLGGFRAHEGHLSRSPAEAASGAAAAPSGKAAYLAEAERHLGPVTTLDRARARIEARRWGRLIKVRRHQAQDTLVLSDDELTLTRWPTPPRRSVTPLRWLIRRAGRPLRRDRAGRDRGDPR